ncbi:adenylate/guanylate cyclase with integral membrane sensor [Nitzschia inconspicua]|uniref:Adenylate/guanylate cyclase with integral membrane sensor n=1 Tax=Nitzschia inconspicua TaxID=303405 RepID=A0A9K3PBP1_9STRA|nr:adenylate/guanylate cyclase with integral membrane sensor [Nitzschia inconspicua]
MKDGNRPYVEPYQLKPFGSTQVVDPKTKKMVPCTPELCPKAEVVPAKGHHGDDDRARVLVPSPLEGQLINRAPFYWSGGLGTLIRKNADPAKKDLIWDFFVYTNSSETSVYDVSSYNSWLDSWRFSQLGTDNQYGNAGWSLEAFEEYKAIQTWGLSKLKANVYKEWNKINTAKGTLDQLDIYRASLGLDVHTEVESCRLNRELMDEKDPSICRKYDAQENENGIFIGILSACLIVMFAVVVCVVMDQRRRKSLKESLEEDDRDEIIEVEGLIFQDNRFISVTRVVLVAAGIAATVGMTMWYQEIQTDAGLESQGSSLYIVILPISFCVLLIIFAVYDWMIARRNRKLIVDAAKTSEVVTFPGKFRDKVLDQTRVVRGGQNDDTDVTERSENQALAELFPDVTVFMADISGFTAWASVREPHEIFTFLEQVFGIFDKAAKKRKVFKVKTIGDCYVACTGAPYVQADHAVRMCRVASDIMESFIEVLDVLPLKHGPDTTDLGLRCGIHSGVVTMGVLRNERERFQLFGDCVNTASRMESTSDPGFIQVSRETADLLFEAGKDKWLSPGGESVIAKGKGVMDTFWLDINRVKESKAQTDTDSSNNALVDWNTESLLGLIKRIVAHRKGTKGSALTVPAADAFGLPSPQTFTNEVAEIIQLPRFEHASPEHLLGADTVLIDDIVVTELRNLIQQVANLYNDNPFHNFEHASHVTMSILKLLSRIVQPSGDDFNNVADHSYGITADPLTHFACAFCGLIHDADHPGVDDFANLRKVLFANDDDQMRFRQIVVNSVMATDIFDPDLKALRNDRWNVAFSETNGKESPQDTINRKATIVIEHLIQASDVAHTMQHWKVYRKWNERLLGEMYLAYIQGRSEKDPTENWAQGEIGFF